MGVLTRELQRVLEELLRKMNAEFRAANEAQAAGNAAVALAHLAKVRELKEILITCIPGIVIVPGLDLPFEPVYATFSDLDLTVLWLCAELERVNLGEPLDRDALLRRRASLKVSRDEVELNILKRQWPAGDEAKQILERLLKEIDAFLARLDAIAAGGAIQDDDVRAYRGIEEAKEDFLREGSDTLPLVDVYWLLLSIGVIDGIREMPWPEFWRERMSQAVGAKEKLEELISGVPAKPAGEWQPGGEDLPPLPPGAA